MVSRELENWLLVSENTLEGQSWETDLEIVSM